MRREYISKALRDEVEKLSNGCCEYCKLLQKYSAGVFANEHIVPLVEGGKNELDNLAKACIRCNGAKYVATTALDPISNQIVSLFHPRKDSWHEHFKWSNDFLQIEGLTPTGRATIIRLNMNQERTVNIRRISLGKGHPPE